MKGICEVVTKRISLEMVFDCPKRLLELFEKYSYENIVSLPDIYLFIFHSCLLSLSHNASDEEIFEILDTSSKTFKYNYIADSSFKNGGDLN